MADNQSAGRHHWMLLPEVESLGSWRRPQCDRSVAAEFGIAHSIVSRFYGDNFKPQEQLSEGSVVVVHEEPHPQILTTVHSFYIGPEENGGRQREKSLDDTTRATGRG
ncbi:hypothetical protein TNCV_2424291 [Trichonephila clavipes]|nr:hypothetical protein TNCV_2424291 [Trichonephila clavipes]